MSEFKRDFNEDAMSFRSRPSSIVFRSHSQDSDKSYEIDKAIGSRVPNASLTFGQFKYLFKISKWGRKLLRRAVLELEVRFDSAALSKPHDARRRQRAVDENLDIGASESRIKSIIPLIESPIQSRPKRGGKRNCQVAQVADDFQRVLNEKKTVNNRAPGIELFPIEGQYSKHGTTIQQEFSTFNDPVPLSQRGQISCKLPPISRTYPVKSYSISCLSKCTFCDCSPGPVKVTVSRHEPTRVKYVAGITDGNGKECFPQARKSELKGLVYNRDSHSLRPPRRSLPKIMVTPSKNSYSRMSTRYHSKVGRYSRTSSVNFSH